MRRISIKDKVVLVTGASSGIGRETARLLAEEGALVVLVARNARELEKVQDEIYLKGGTSYVYPLDISDIEAVKETAERIIKKVGVPWAIINNAGQGTWKFMDETAYEDVQHYMAVPFYGAFYMTKAFLPRMLERRSGCIVNLTSYAGMIPFAGATAYIVARKAMIGFHEALTADLKRTGIRTSLAYFAKVNSNYWQNNPGSEERLPGASALIPSISPRRAARAIVRGIQKKRLYIYAPGILFLFNLLIRHLPGLARRLIHATGYSRKLITL